MGQISSLLSSFTDISGGIMAAASSMAAGDEARRVAGYNKSSLLLAAQDARQRGADAAAEHRQKVKQILSRQNVAFAANGIDSSSGSALDTSADTAQMGELDALRIMNNAQRVADNFTAQAKWQKYQGDQAWTASRIGAFAAMASGGGKAASGVLGNAINSSQNASQTQPPSFTSSDESTAALNYKASDLTEGSGYNGYSLLN